MERTISGMMGKGSVNHNTRAFSAKNVDKERSRDNVEFCHSDIKEVYHTLFDKALERYNAKQKRLCAKIVAETDLYETDKEVQNLIDWVCLSEQIKENNNTIRNLTGEYKKIEPDCREGVRAQLERMKELCKERNNLYEKQNDLKGQKQKIEKSLER